MKIMKRLMRKLGEETTQIRILCIGVAVLFFAVLIPLFRISAYNCMGADDYVFAAETAKTWRETHSVGKVLAMSAEETVEMYRTWQGNFFSTWLGKSLMGFFAEDAYYVGTILALGGFVLAEGVLLMLVLIKGMGADRNRAFIVTAGCIVMQLLKTPYPVEAFYWFTGAIVYTFMHVQVLLLVTLLLLLLWKPKRKRGVVLLEMGILLLSFAIGGGNYISAITVTVVYAFYAFWMFWKKHPYRLLALGDVFFFLVIFMVNVLSPGNGIRQTSTGISRMSAMSSILLSLKEAGTYCLVNLEAPCIVLALLLIPIFINIVNRRKYRFPFPFLVLFFSFCLFAAQFTPNIYALGITGAGRVQNLYRFNFYLLLYGNELYWVGWLRRRFFAADLDAQEEKNRISYVLPAWVIGG